MDFDQAQSDWNWAIRTARHDSRFLVSPTARERALSILDDANGPISNAARTILLDGGSWQGIDGYRQFTTDLSVWSAAAKRLDAPIAGIDPVTN